MNSGFELSHYRRIQACSRIINVNGSQSFSIEKRASKHSKLTEMKVPDEGLLLIGSDSRRGDAAVNFGSS